MGLPHDREVFAEGEGLLVSFCLHGVGAASLESRTADEAGAAPQGEGDGDGVDELAIGLVDIDRFILHNIDADEQDSGLYSRLVGGNGGHLAHAAANRKDFAPFDDQCRKVAVETFLW